MVRLIRSILITLVCLALLLFLPAGDWKWPRGWLFFAVFTITAVICLIILLRVNPDVLVARSRLLGPGTKRWDVILITLLLPAVVAIVPVAALDDGRFHWYPVLWWVSALGYVLLIAGFAGSVWAEAYNKFAEPSAFSPNAGTRSSARDRMQSSGTRFIQPVFRFASGPPSLWALFGANSGRNRFLDFDRPDPFGRPDASN